MSNTKFHLKIKLNDSGLVLPVANPDLKIGSLFGHIAARFIELGVKLDPQELENGLEIEELHTDDGFSLHSNDRISDVLNSGSRVVVVPRAGWLQRNLDLVAKSWLAIDQADAVDDVTKWISFGYHSHNKLYFKIGTGYQWGNKPHILLFKLFSSADLNEFKADGRVLAVEYKGENWFAEAHFIVENKKATHVELSVKSKSDTRPFIKKQKVKVEKMLEAIGEPETVQTSFESYNPDLYQVPSPVKTGTSYDPSIFQTPVYKTDAKAEGKIPLTIVQKARVSGDQSWASGDGFNNFFDVPLNVTNAEKEKVLVNKITSEMLLGGVWTPTETFIVDSREVSFVVGPVDHDNITIRARTHIKAPQIERQKRAHNSLPNPLMIRIHFEDTAGNKSMIEVEHRNPPLDVFTEDYRRKNAGSKKFLHYAECDDISRDFRLFSEVIMSDDETGVNVQTKSGTYNTLNSAFLRSQGFKAKAEGKAEFPLEDMSWSENDNKTDVSLLVDLERGHPYGIKFVQQTPNATTTSVCKIPQLKDE